jgi:hypothetical protein
MERTLTNILNNITTGNWIIAVLWAVTLAICTGVFFRKCFLKVPAHQIAVIHDQKRAVFSGFLHPGRYLLLPGVEKVSGWISTAQNSATGVCQARTADGYRVSLTWVIRFYLDPNIVGPGLQPAMAQILTADPLKMARSYINVCLQRVTERISWQDLRQGNLHHRLKCQSVNTVARCLALYGIQVDEIAVETIRQLGTATFAAEPVPLTQPTAGKRTAPGEIIQDVQINAVQAEAFGYYEAMAREISQHLNVHSDSALGKLVN